MSNLKTLSSQLWEKYFPDLLSCNAVTAPSPPTPLDLGIFIDSLTVLGVIERCSTFDVAIAVAENEPVEVC